MNIWTVEKLLAAASMSTVKCNQFQALVMQVLTLLLSVVFFSFMDIYEKLYNVVINQTIMCYQSYIM